jgi:DNA polymerase-3 subunit epsilon
MPMPSPDLQTIAQQLAARLKLTKPLVAFDCETTGKYPERDRIVEIALVKLYPDGRTTRFTSLVNPTIPIPPEVSEIHGITDAMVKDMPTFAQLAPTLVKGLGDCDLFGYNAKRFDTVLLVAEFARVDPALFSVAGRRIVDPQVIFFKREPRDLEGALKFFCGAALEGAHRAEADVDATLAVFCAQLERYDDLPATVAELHAYCAQKEPHWVDEQGKLVWLDGEVCVGFGKKAGKSLRWLYTHESSFLAWILRSDFSPDVKAIVEAAAKGTFPVRREPAA